jgi:hypothetical protein
MCAAPAAAAAAASGFRWHLEALLMWFAYQHACSSAGTQHSLQESGNAACATALYVAAAVQAIPLLWHPAAELLWFSVPAVVQAVNAPCQGLTGQHVAVMQHEAGLVGADDGDAVPAKYQEL